MLESIGNGTFKSIAYFSLVHPQFFPRYWVGKNTKISYSLTFASGQPNNYLGRQNCLGLSKEEKTFEFQDIDCHGRFEEKFICQRICRYE